MSIIPAPYRWLALMLLIVAALGCGYFKGDQHRARVDEAELQKVLTAQAKVTQAQRDHNLDLQRAAEKNYVVTRDGQDHFFVTTVKEIHEAAAPLAACPLPDAVRVRLNAAAACARADSPAACGAADDEVPHAR